MTHWHFLVDRKDYRNTTVADFEPDHLGDGEIRVRVDAFGFTANNVTYAAAGDRIGYWTFFPAPDLGDGVTWGRIPVWGFADVVESRSDPVAVGDRFYGYFPMSTELVMTPTRVSDKGLVDGAEHRAALPAVYNSYIRCAADPMYDVANEEELMLYRPLFFTSLLIDDFLDDNEFFGTSTVVLASASSKTAFGTAHLLHQRGGITVIGLTSRGNVGFVEGLGCYDQVLTYDDIELLPDGPAAFVDMSGNAAVVQAVHERYGDDLTHSMVVGLTHWEDRAGSADGRPGPEQKFFFAPTQIEKRHGDWGGDVLESKLAEAWGPFIRKASDWVTVEHSSGPDAVSAVYVETLEGNTDPDVARVLHP